LLAGNLGTDRTAGDTRLGQCSGMTPEASVGKGLTCELAGWTIRAWRRSCIALR
jgi:hypothetical protein